MRVLNLGQQTGSILPGRAIKLIAVDREMGLTVHAFKRTKVINLGYEDYPRKYRLLPARTKTLASIRYFLG